MIAATQFSFSLSFVSFITVAAKSVIASLFGYELDLWTIAYVLMCILIPMACVRNISKFAFTFLVGNVMIISTVIVVSVVMIMKLVNREHHILGENLLPINYDSYMAFVGFSIYSYEGIGVVMPIMQNCDCVDKFPKLFFLAILTLTVIYILFSELCYLTLGDKLTETFITQQLDKKSAVVLIL